MNQLHELLVLFTCSFSFLAGWHFKEYIKIGKNNKRYEK
jgi:hypothetical protein